MLYFLKWVSIILVALFLAWLLPILFISDAIKSYDSLSDADKYEYVKESAQVIKNRLEPVFEKYKLNVNSSIVNSKSIETRRANELKRVNALKKSIKLKQFNDLRIKGSTLDYNHDYINVRNDEACGYWSNRYFETKTDFNKIYLRYSCSR